MSVTRYNADITNAAGEVVTPAGTLVTDTFGPSRWALLNDGTKAWVRPRTHTDFDQGAPNAGINPDTTLPYRLPTTERLTGYNPGTGQDVETVSETTTGYDPVQTGDASGWQLGTATRTTDVMPGGGSANITRITRYDGEGRVIETRQPLSNGADAGTTKTVYYTAAVNSTHPACGSKPQWAGLTCKTFPAAAPSSGPSLPDTTITGYSALLAPTTTVETSGSVTRTTTNTYLADGRADKTRTAVSGLSSSTFAPGTRTVYAASTGLPIEQIQLDSAGADTTSKVATVYDAWGRVTSYTPAPGETTTTSYDAEGRVASVTDPKGTTTWGYNADSDAAGNKERRGLATSVTVSNPGGATVSFRGAYDADGALVEQELPGGVVQRTTFDLAGEPVGMSYSGQVTTVAGGSTSVDPDSPWLAWSQDNDVSGRVRREWTPAGSAFTDGAAGATDTGDALAYDRQYAYDRAGRLTEVRDRTAAATGSALEPGDPASTAAGCQVRAYSFDANGNRRTLTRRAPNADGSCGASGGTQSAWTPDTADRLTTGANGTGSYSYDGLGRALTIPAVDTPKGASTGDLGIGYYDTDAVRSLTQSGTTTTYSLDPAGRRASADTGPTGGAVTSRLVRHYADESDNPSWVESIAGGSTTVTRYAESLGGDLAVSITGAALSLPLATLHGDVVANVTVTANGPAVGIDGWADYDEYGNPRSPAAADTIDGPAGYGWLGAKQRAGDTTGLLLMGARLYNPVTGQFTSLDPVDGGNETAHSYPADPINRVDLDGLASIDRELGGGGFASARKAAELLAKMLRKFSHKTKVKRANIRYAVAARRAKHTFEPLRRSNRGADGGRSWHVRERAGRTTISVTHRVRVRGRIVHQHQRHIGRYGGERYFPDEWTRWPCRNSRHC